MEIGSKIKSLRLKKGLTQEELGERTDLTKGHISQLERNLNSPSIETLFALLEVLGTTPKEFFDEPKKNVKVVYSTSDQTIYSDDELKYSIRWLVPRSNENEMEPVHITFHERGEFKRFEPSSAETFIYILNGKVTIKIGNTQHTASKGDAVYYDASEQHCLTNAHNGTSEILLVATNSYL
ncbi:helix-turn-helix domain-containing protein [Sporosarcina sp. JAI121]|uniref:helix-turn-helix domain-containing protein n=1 Tax=Sporosarcina sp. JAI121 TaxID=2723064 RepID=UPI0015C87C23|nr:XRE family transcriptional regulator [Sporosarcina sp. JAI121]NYF24074.1 transcriptional regulator with XRE-family HTH domain [Sporosarcina sp. JAI121]